MDLKIIGKNVKNLRLKKGLTQAQLAEMAEISTVHMSHIETGAVAMSLDCLINISSSLETTPNNILLGEIQLSSDGALEILKQSVSNLSSDESGLLIKIAELLEELKINRK
ncbi:MAG: helix-turn-helix transcriptional regulator [Ruminococcaceae bacterium]|nr:helix-turn-helix transcriptional regulator [Oscillospiraceae bacterium]